MRSLKKTSPLVPVAVLLAVGVAGCAAGTRAVDGAAGTRIVAEIVGEPIRTEYDGIEDDLLTAGLGIEGLRAAPPDFADPRRPTRRELRRRAIHASYRGLVDLTPGGGFGTLFGPRGDERIAGVEYLFAIRMPSGEGITTGLLQIPRSFDPDAPCVIAVASSGSRGIYGALPTAGEWGLRHGCAVIHSDKGTGTGLFDLDSGRGIRIDGLVGEADDPLLGFAPRDRQVEAPPHTLLFKHAHAGLNVEARWGEYLLQAIEAGLALLNREFPARARPFGPEDTLIVAAGISNGGATVLRAVERDAAGWIDGAVVSEPNALVAGARQLTVESGGRRFADVGATVFDYATLHMLLQPCAILAETEPTAPFAAATQAMRARFEAWCRELGERGVLPAGDPAEQAREARRLLIEAGILPEALRLGHVATHFFLWPAIAATYAAAYAGVDGPELPCGLRFAATDAAGRPRALTEEELARAFADSSGIPPTAGVHLVASGPDGEARVADAGSVALAACLRALATGRWSGGEPPPGFAALAERIAEGQRAARMTARLRGRPVIVIHGRGDGLIAVNHASRAYYALNRLEEGEASELRYYEVVHGQHFDAFIGLPGEGAHYVPLQPHLLRAMDLMMARLRDGAPLPPSQVVRSRPREWREGALEALGSAHLGELRERPGGDAINFEGAVLRVPE